MGFALFGCSLEHAFERRNEARKLVVILQGENACDLVL